MGLKVQLGRRALADLAEIRRFLEENAGAAVAEKVRQHLRQRIHRLAGFPWLGVQTRHPEIRRLSANVYPYMIFYTVIGDTVKVLHVRHAAREDFDLDELSTK